MHFGFDLSRGYGIHAYGILWTFSPEWFIERVRKFRYPLDPALPHGWNHLDIDFDGNVLVKDNKIRAILDFDDLDYSPSVVCLGFTLWDIFFDGGEALMREYLAEYQKIRQLTKEECETLPHVIQFRNYIVFVINLLFEKKAENEKRFFEVEKEVLESPLGSNPLAFRRLFS